MDDEQFMRLLQSASGQYRVKPPERSSSDRGTAPQSFEHTFRPQYLPLSQLSIQFPGRGAASGASSLHTARWGSWPMAVGLEWVQLLLSVIFLSGPACMLTELAILLSRIGVNRDFLRSTYLYRAAELLTRWDEAVDLSQSSGKRRA